MQFFSWFRGKRLLSGAGRGRRGAASVEAVVVLPVFIVIFAAILFVRNKQLLTHAAEARARSCAWQYSANNCTSIPSGCEDVLRTSTAENPASKAVEDVFQDAKNGLGKDPKGVFEAVTRKLLGHAIQALFGKYSEAKVEHELARPSVLGGDSSTSPASASPAAPSPAASVIVVGRYHLACNLAPQKPVDVVKDAWGKITGL
jgi:hypothetical protein